MEFARDRAKLEELTHFGVDGCRKWTRTGITIQRNKGPTTFYRGSDIYKRGSKNGMAANISCIIQSEMPSELPFQPLKRRISSQPQKVADMRRYPPRKHKQSTQENELQLPFVREGQNPTKRDVRKAWLQTPVASCTWRCLPSCPAKIRCRSSPKAERLFVFPETLESIPNRISKYGRIAPLSEKGVQKIVPFEACVQRRACNRIGEGVQACRKSNWTVEIPDRDTNAIAKKDNNWNPNTSATV
ncbi:hypothetical protein LXL04_029737 [Taraxacum kok-saghyz]